MTALLSGWVRALALVVFLWWGAAVAAHLTPNSEVKLRITESAVIADMIVPQGEYAYATSNPVDGSPGSIALARRYLTGHIAVTGPDGRPWRVEIGKAEFVQIAGPPDLHAFATFRPPDDARIDQFTLDWHVLVDELPNHFALIVVSGEGGSREIAGAVRTGNTRIAIERHEGPWAVLGSATRLGMRHIATGYDHLAFLLALLLAAPLRSAAGRWSGRRPLRQMLSNLLRIVTAFTIGHSATLVGATLFDWRLPTAPVEVAIALSVLISAAHALRPLFPGREPLVAGLFGLVHGLAFATLVRHTGAATASSAFGLLGFNLGIEIVQLIVVGASLPLLIAMTRWRHFARARIALGVGCALLSTAWIIQRLAI